MEKIFSDNKRVLQVRDASNNIIFNQPDLIFQVGYNLAPTTTGMVVYYDFKKTLDYIAVRWNVGTNAEKLFSFSSTNIISKNLDNGVDGNPIETTNNVVYNNNYIYLPNIDDIEEISFYSSLNNVYAVRGRAVNIIQFEAPKAFLNCKKIDFTNNSTGIYAQFNRFSEIKNVFPNVEYIRLRGNSTADETNLTDLPLLTNLKYLYMTLYSGGIGGTHIFNFLPSSVYFTYLYFLQAIEFKLEDYFTGTRIALGLAPQNGLSAHSVKYNGGAIFPSVLTDNSKYPIPYIIDFGRNISQKLTGDELSQFIIDFANQVTSVNITNSSSKKMNFRETSPNISYEDLSQPLFTTYASALAHINSTLGITVTFT